MITNENLKTPRGLVEILSQFLSPPELGLEETSKRILAGLTAIITAPILFLFSVLHLEKAEYPLGILLLIAGTGLAISVIFIRKFKSVTIFSRTNIIFVGLRFLYLLIESGPHGYMANWLDHWSANNYSNGLFACMCSILGSRTPDQGMSVLQSWKVPYPFF